MQDNQIKASFLAMVLCMCGYVGVGVHVLFYVSYNLADSSKTYISKQFQNRAKKHFSLLFLFGVIVIENGFFICCSSFYFFFVLKFFFLLNFFVQVFVVFEY